MAVEPLPNFTRPARQRWEPIPADRRERLPANVWFAEQAGIRAMPTHPIDEDAARFYTRFGFIASPLRERQLLLLLKDARRWTK